ncbi:hypothetical protein [Leuconostoc citreum]|uniref:hypothetical protein n=1 Tax=Leuconostoc citreum TaxID=33964 RepID=UPI001C1F9B29|nr:hypothetical protein [Leuconostoc citreum]MBU7451609.1 hypothetical protein [Leuconostoc citreum]
MVEENSIRITATLRPDVAKKLDSFATSSGLKKSSIVNASLTQFLNLNSDNLINSGNKKITKIILLGVESLNPKRVPFFHVGYPIPNQPTFGLATDIIISDDGLYFFIALSGGDSIGRFGAISNFTVSTSDYVAVEFD